MRALLLLVAGLGLLALVLAVFVRTPPADLARRLQMAGGIALILLAVALLFLRQFALAIPLGFAGYMILRRNAATRPAASGRSSTVRSAGLEMALDHATGEMDGRVLAGRYEGRLLSKLTRRQLLEVREDFASDADSLRLLETYLDRAQPAWREVVQADEPKGHGPTARAGGMSTQEAYQILGLEPGAGEAEVREAHRRLMKQVHPDRGGSAALAAQINEAKERIVGKHHR